MQMSRRDARGDVGARKLSRNVCRGYSRGAVQARRALLTWAPSRRKGEVLWGGGCGARRAEGSLRLMLEATVRLLL
eukprot:1631795-Pleurochrysis_carterae.AAC.1